MSLRMLAELARNRWTLAGIAALAIGVCLQAWALSAAPLTLVEPILVAELPLALLLASILFGVRLDARAWIGVTVTAGALAALLWAASPHGGSVDRASTLDWILALAATVGACALLLLLARGARPGLRAALIGAAAG